MKLIIALAAASMAVASSNGAAGNEPKVLASADSAEAAVRKADDEFWRAFNSCNAAKMARFLTSDVEFYHDLTGLTRGRAAVTASLMKGPCGTKDLHVRRALIPSSLHYERVPRYGAILTGEHSFSVRQGNAPEKVATLARFLVVWSLDDGRWAMSRIVSYDHHPAPREFPPSITLPEDVLEGYVGRYDTSPSGLVVISLEKGELVLTSRNLRLTLVATAPGKFYAKERDLSVNFEGVGPTTAIEIEENGVTVAKGKRISEH